MSMTTTGEPLNLSAPTADDTPGWVADFAGNARKTNNYAKEMNRKIGDTESLSTTEKSLVMAVNELKTSLDGKTETNHASNSGKYGLASKNAYGHAKSVDSLDRASYADGEMLSAHQGYVLEKSVEKIGNNRLVTLDEIDLVTEPGFYVDALAVGELNRNKISKYNYSGTGGYMSISRSGLPYTCPEDCMMSVIRFACASSAECTLQVNDTTIGRANSSSVYTCFAVPLSKGDVVSSLKPSDINSATRMQFYTCR